MDWYRASYETVRMLSKVVEDKYLAEAGEGAEVHEVYMNKRAELIARNENLWRYWSEWEIDDISLFDFVYAKTMPATWVE